MEFKRQSCVLWVHFIYIKMNGKNYTFQKWAEVPNLGGSRPPRPFISQNWKCLCTQKKHIWTTVSMKQFQKRSEVIGPRNHQETAKSGIYDSFRTISLSDDFGFFWNLYFFLFIFMHKKDPENTWLTFTLVVQNIVYKSQPFYYSPKWSQLYKQFHKSFSSPKWRKYFV